MYAFGAVLARAFATSGWLADIHGVTRDDTRGGVVLDLPSHCFGTDADGIAAKYATDVLITETWDKALGELGFIALSHCKDTPLAAFFGSASVQKPQRYDRTPATVSARLSATLQFIFCVSRFAHYLKVIGRDCVGAYATAQGLQEYLRRWLLTYTIASDDASPEAKARAPLREAQVEVHEAPGRPGSYTCVCHTGYVSARPPVDARTPRHDGPVLVRVHSECNPDRLPADKVALPSRLRCHRIDNREHEKCGLRRAIPDRRAGRAAAV